MYVNDFSVQLGDEGQAAVKELLRRGREAGVFPDRPEDGN
jgi:predicted solute-binding protein